MIPEEYTLKDCPPGGTGVHRWIFGSACYSVDNGLTDEEAEPLIRAAMTRNPNPASEIRDALRSARREGRKSEQLWNPRDEEKIKEILESPKYGIETTKSRGCHFLQHAGSIKEALYTGVFSQAHPEIILDYLFRGDPMLCMGKTNYIFDTKYRRDWRGIEKFQSLIVPSAMSAMKGKTKAGNLSAHSLENTGLRQYLVIEFDQGTMEDQWKLLWFLKESQKAPLVLICSSGGKSLHGWFNVKETDELLNLRFMQIAVELGADPRTWLASQFVRLPDGTRYETKQRQTCIYFDEAEL